MIMLVTLATMESRMVLESHSAGESLDAEDITDLILFRRSHCSIDGCNAQTSLVPSASVVTIFSFLSLYYLRLIDSTIIILFYH